MTKDSTEELKEGDNMWFRRKEITQDIDQAIIGVKAELAKAKLLPESDFTIYGRHEIVHGVDRKPTEIARLEAQLAYYEVIKDDAGYPLAETRKK